MADRYDSEAASRLLRKLANWPDGQVFDLFGKNTTAGLQRAATKILHDAGWPNCKIAKLFRRTKATIGTWVDYSQALKKREYNRKQHAEMRRKAKLYDQTQLLTRPAE